MVISTFTCDGKKNQEIGEKESRLIMSGQLVIEQMFESGIITQASLIIDPFILDFAKKGVNVSLC